MHHPNLEKELDNIISSQNFDPSTRAEFAELLEKDKFLRDEGVKEHFCLYFLPYNPASKEIFLVHHKKAAQWLAPGGHIDSDETLLQTLNREISEELGIPDHF